MDEHDDPRPAYEPPQIDTYTEEAILEELGPAQTQMSGVRESSHL